MFHKTFKGQNYTSTVPSSVCTGHTQLNKTCLEVTHMKHNNFCWVENELYPRMIYYVVTSGLRSEKRPQLVSKALNNKAFQMNISSKIWNNMIIWFLPPTPAMCVCVQSEQHREITQIQYLAWPDHGVPDDSTDFLDFVALVRAKRAGQDHPMVVHCRYRCHCPIRCWEPIFNCLGDV